MIHDKLEDEQISDLENHIKIKLVPIVEDLESKEEKRQFNLDKTSGRL